MRAYARLAIEKTLEQNCIDKIYTFSNKPIIEGEIFIKINPIKNVEEYNSFIINSLPYFIDEEYLLIIQWDGFPLKNESWKEYFLNYDYIGAAWPNAPEGVSVGNGGFSLRSRLFLESSRGLMINSESDFKANVAEDVFLCRDNRIKLEKNGILFAPVYIANEFSYESIFIKNTFGFHGVFNLVNELPEEFLIKNLDELLLRTSTPDILFRLIINAKSGNKNLFLRELMGVINKNKELAKSIVEILNRVRFK